MLCVVKLTLDPPDVDELNRNGLAIVMVGCDMDMHWHVWWSGGRLLLSGGACFNTVNVILSLSCAVSSPTISCSMMLRFLSWTAVSR